MSHGRSSKVFDFFAISFANAVLSEAVYFNRTIDYSRVAVAFTGQKFLTFSPVATFLPPVTYSNSTIPLLGTWHCLQL
jgi:hypothetical protein